MAILVTFSPSAMSPEQFDTVIRRLEAAGAGAPPGRLHHVAARVGTTIRVVDVYESPQAFESFGQALMPILRQEGISLPPPEILEIHHMAEGVSASAR